jgi:APA family basic amino acid/polyamine antiporter
LAIRTSFVWKSTTAFGALALRLKDPDRHRPFRVPFVLVVAPLGAAGCLYTMYYLPRVAWERFGIWLLIGTALYFAYGRRHSNLGAERDKANLKS